MPTAYRYLPKSVAYLPEPDELLAMLRAAGFADADRDAALGRHRPAARRHHDRPVTREAADPRRRSTSTPTSWPAPAGSTATST